MKCAASWSSSSATSASSEGGLQVYTTIDPYMQRAADAAVDQSIAEIEKSLPKQKTPRDPLQAALIAIDPATGAVRAMVGGRDFRASNFNRATRAKRQPGSAFKPFVYAAAVEDGFGPDDMIEGLDEPVEASNAAWTPDDEHVDEEALTLREGLRLSSNRAAVQLLTTVGLQQTMKSGARFRLRRPAGRAVGRARLRRGHAERRSPRPTARSRTTARCSIRTLMRRVVDRDGMVLFENKRKPQQAIRPVTAYLMADMLRGVIDGGTGYGVRQMGFTLPAGGKTGTTNDYQRRVVHRLHAVARDRRVGRLRPAADDPPQRLRRGARRADVDAVHEGRDQGP